MPLNLTAAHSSRVSKPTRSPLRRTSSQQANLRSPLTQVRRSKSSTNLSSEHDTDLSTDGEDDATYLLPDNGLIRTLETDQHLCDVPQTIQYTLDNMFTPLPRAGGFNSVRCSEILRYRANLPGIVTFAQIHARLPSPTQTEREVASLVRQGILRRINVPGRGAVASSVGEGVVVARDMVARMRELVENGEVNGRPVIEMFLEDLKERPGRGSVDGSRYGEAGIRELMQLGFVTARSGISDLAANSSEQKFGNIARAASGSIAAVGGDDAIGNAGGRGGIREGGEMMELQVTMPGLGQFLKLVTAARSHLMSLLSKLRFRQAPLSLLRERWEGGAARENGMGKGQRYGREFVGVVASRTRMWRDFYGLRFDFVLAECLGAGLVEVFDSGSVGQGVRVA